jgi:hypothetical protein
LPQFLQHLIGRDEEWVFLENATNDDHWVSPHDVHDYFGTKLVQIIRSTYGIIVFGEDIVEPRFILHDVVYAGPIFQRPLHIGDEASETVALRLAALQHFLDQGQHPVLVEATLAQVGVLPTTDLELSIVLGLVDGNACLLKASPVFGAVSVFDDVKGLLALIEALFDEREEYSIFLVFRVEKGADVPGPTESRACQPYSVVRLAHMHHPSWGLV